MNNCVCIMVSLKKWEIRNYRRDASCLPGIWIRKAVDDSKIRSYANISKHAIMQTTPL